MSWDKPDNMDKLSTTWIDINARPDSSNGFEGDAWATMGGKWGEWADGKADIYHNTPFHHNQFHL